MEYAFFWAILALFVGVWAGKRGRGSGSWFVLGILISPLLAGLILLALPDLSDAGESERTHVKCGFCSEKVLRTAIKCKHCGSPLTPNSYQESMIEKLTKLR